MIRAVIDTNVLVSALISPSGNEALILLAARYGLIMACFSEDILREYAEVLARPKFSFPPDEISELTTLLRANGELISSGFSANLLPDPTDSKFLACAQAAPAIIVTGNRRHFPNDRCGSIEGRKCGRDPGSNDV